MVDSPVKKSVLRSLRDLIQHVLHVVLIPVIAVLRFINNEIAALITELSKI